MHIPSNKSTSRRRAVYYQDARCSLRIAQIRRFSILPCLYRDRHVDSNDTRTHLPSLTILRLVLNHSCCSSDHTSHHYSIPLRATAYTIAYRVPRAPHVPTSRVNPSPHNIQHDIAQRTGQYQFHTVMLTAPRGRGDSCRMFLIVETATVSKLFSNHLSANWRKCSNQPPVCPLAKTGKLVAVVGFQRGRVREACCRGLWDKRGKARSLNLHQSPRISSHTLSSALHEVTLVPTTMLVPCPRCQGLSRPDMEYLDPGRSRCIYYH